MTLQSRPLPTLLLHVLLSNPSPHFPVLDSFRSIVHILQHTCSVRISLDSSKVDPDCCRWSEPSFLTSHLYVLVSFSTEWCSPMYFLAFVVMYLRSWGDFFNSLASVINSFQGNNKETSWYNFLMLKVKSTLVKLDFFNTLFLVWLDFLVDNLRRSR